MLIMLISVVLVCCTFPLFIEVLRMASDSQQSKRQALIKPSWQTNNTGKRQWALKRVKRGTPKLVKYCYKGTNLQHTIQSTVCEVLDCVRDVPAIDHAINVQIVCKDTCLTKIMFTMIKL
ncbi:hypothetical protein NQD34_008940 [Periophthalmus magnuspinnatus]|nr:hypothetical protein NQD34_008940 [Periophthalmus magnuspinnatus]